MIAKAFRFAKTFPHHTLKSLRDKNSLRDHAGCGFFYAVKYQALAVNARAKVGARSKLWKASVCAWT
jgi:hypothetical protein